MRGPLGGWAGRLSGSAMPAGAAQRRAAWVAQLTWRNFVLKARSAPAQARGSADVGERHGGGGQHSGRSSYPGPHHRGRQARQHSPSACLAPLARPRRSRQRRMGQDRAAGCGGAGAAGRPALPACAALRGVLLGAAGPASRGVPPWSTQHAQRVVATAQLVAGSKFLASGLFTTAVNTLAHVQQSRQPCPAPTRQVLAGHPRTATRRAHALPAASLSQLLTSTLAAVLAVCCCALFGRRVEVGSCPAGRPTAGSHFLRSG